MPPVFVGHVATRSGPDRDAGEQAFRAIDLAVKEQDTKEGQRPIQVRHTDTRGNLDAFEGEAVRLITVNRVLAILGGTTAEEVVRLDKAQVPLVSLAGHHTREMSEWVFLTGLSPSFRGQVLARFLVEKNISGPVLVLVDQEKEESLALVENFNQKMAVGDKKAKNRPAPIIIRYGNEGPVGKWKDRPREEKPAAILFAGDPADLLNLLAEMKTRPSLVLFGGEDNGVRTLTESGQAEGIYLVTPYVADLEWPIARNFSSRYGQEYSQVPRAPAALAFDAARILFEAIHRCGNELTGDRLVKELAQIKDFPGLTGPLAFDAERRLRRPAFLVRIEKGKLRTVKKFQD